MHKSFAFPINCVSQQLGFESVHIVKHEGKSFITAGNETFPGYDVFEEIEILPSLVNMVENVKTHKSNKEQQIIDWVKKWGLLNPNRFKWRTEQDIQYKTEKIGEDYPFRQSLDDFWTEAEKLYYLWLLYRCIANRDLKSLIETARIDKDIEPFSHENFFGIPNYHRIYFFEDKPFGDSMKLIVKDPGNPLKDYQLCSTKYLLKHIEQYINFGKLSGSFIELEPDNEEQDTIKVTSEIKFNNLLEALYMQFFILLSNNNTKICLVCNEPFIPLRKDRKYCYKGVNGNTCQNTAKTRRHRKNINNKA